MERMAETQCWLIADAIYSDKAMKKQVTGLDGILRRPRFRLSASEAAPLNRVKDQIREYICYLTEKRNTT